MERTTLTALTARAEWTQEVADDDLVENSLGSSLRAVMSPKTLNTVNIYSSPAFARRNPVPVRLLRTQYTAVHSNHTVSVGEKYFIDLRPKKRSVVCDLLDRLASSPPPI